MSREQKALAAIKRAGIEFSYLLPTDSRGVKSILNLDAFNPMLGVAPNMKLMILPVYASDTVRSLTAKIQEKWGRNA